MPETTDGPLQAGAAVVDITPPQDCLLAGGAFGRSNGVLHRLQARVLVLEVAGRRQLLVSCDLLGFDNDLADELRAVLATCCGTEPGAVLLAATHTHNGPVTLSLRGGWGEPDPAYRQQLRDALLDAAGRAVAALRPARLAAGTSACPGLNRNRCSASEDLVDDSLTWLAVWPVAAAAPLAVALVVPTHPVNLHSGGQISGDFHSLVVERLQRAWGTDCVVLPCSGAAGDLLPANFAFAASLAEAEQTAECVVGALQPAVTSAAEAATSAITLTSGERLAELPLQPLMPAAERDELVERSQAELAERGGWSATDWRACQAVAIAAWTDEVLSEAEQASRTVPLQVWRAGPLALAAVPAELFTAFGQAIATSPAAPVCAAVCLANGYRGYLPVAAAFESRGYESFWSVFYAGLQHYAPEAGAVFCAAALAALADHASAGDACA